MDAEGRSGGRHHHRSNGGEDGHRSPHGRRGLGVDSAAQPGASTRRPLRLRLDHAHDLSIPSHHSLLPHIPTRRGMDHRQRLLHFIHLFLPQLVCCNPLFYTIMILVSHHTGDSLYLNFPSSTFLPFPQPCRYAHQRPPVK